MGYRQRILLVSPHAHAQCFDPPQDKPAIKGTRHCTGCILEKGQTLLQFFFLDDDSPSDNIRVSTEVLGGRVYNQVRTQSQGRLPIRGRKGVVDSQEGIAGVGQIGYGSDIDQA
jgi:hypothetical protein